MKLLTTANYKMQKSVEYGYLQAIMHLMPDTSINGGPNTCPHASPGCSAACLNTAGRGAFNRVQKARMERTKFFRNNQGSFLDQLDNEIYLHCLAADKLKLKPVVRLNGTSDIPWESMFRVEMYEYAERSHVTFMDYTKSLARMRRYINGEFNDGALNWYHLTFSRSETNQSECEEVARLGGNIAVVFDTPKGEPLPASSDMFGRTMPVIDGRIHDLRFLDRSGSIVGLSALGRARRDPSGFVVPSGVPAVVTVVNASR